MKKCELCRKVARMYCDSDQASLCWDCDSRVHAANFLVSKHTRTLLCNSCQSPTPWTGSGPNLGPTVSVCEACLNGRIGDRDPDGEDDVEDDRIGNDDDDGENQVVPLNLQVQPISSSSEECSSRRGGLSGSGFGSSSATTSSGSSRFSYGEMEKKGGQKGRSWRCR